MWPCMRSTRTSNPRPRPLDKNSVVAFHKTLSPRTVHHTAMAPTTTRMSFTNEYKMKIVEIAIQIGYRPAGKQFGISEANVRRWHREMKAISHAPKNRCITKARNGAKFPQIETEVCAFIHEKRNDDGFRFSRTNICQEALRVAGELLGLSETEFIASAGWDNKFMHRKGYTIRELNSREHLCNQPTSPADQDSITATENPDTSPAATEHGQESPPAMVSEPDACNIPSTEVPEASPFQEWAWRSSEISDLLSVPMNNEQLEDLDFSFDTTKFDEMPWLPAYCALQEKNDQSYQIFHPMSLG